MNETEKETRVVVATRTSGVLDLVSGLALVGAAVAAAVYSALKENWIVLAVDIVLAAFGIFETALYFAVKRRPKELVVVCGEEILYYDSRLRRMETTPLKSLRAADVCADGSKRGRKAVLTLYFEREKVEINYVKDAAQAAALLRNSICAASVKETGE